MWVTVLIFNCFLVGFASPTNPSNCDITDIDDGSWSGYLTKDFDDHQIDEHIFESSYNGKLTNLQCTCTTGACTINEYVKFTTNETYFYFYTTELLQDFDKDMLHSDEPNKNNVVYSCSMTCADESQTSSLRIKSTIADYNDYPPAFSEGNRTYGVPTPIMPKSDFSFFGDDISASDMDFSNEHITFEITPADFDIVVTVDSSTIPSTFKANFRANKILLITDPVTYTIIATDSGTNPGTLSSNITVTLALNEEYVIDTPSFNYPSYSFQYEDDNSLTPLNGTINVKSNKSPTVKLSGELSDHFSANYDTEASVISLSVTTNIDTPESAFIILTLSATTDTTASTTIIIYFPNASSEEKIKFNQPLYSGNYNDSTLLVTLVTDIKVTTSSTQEPTVFFSDGLDDFDPTAYFTLTKDADHYNVNVANKLPDNILANQKSLVMTLEADVDTSKGYATLVIDLPVQETTGSIQFENPLYSGTYEIKDKTGTVTTDTIKIIAEGSEDIDVSITNDFKEYFNSVYDSSTSEVTINKISEVPDSVLKDLSNIPIVLTATLKTTPPVSTSSVVNLKIVNDDTSEGSLEFNSLLYNGTFVVKDDKLSVDPITIKTDKPEIVSVSINNDYNKYFSTSFDSSTLAVTITKTNNIPATDLQDTVTLVLSATLTGTQVSASSVVNIKVENENTPGSIQYDNLLYSGTYEIKNKIGTVTTDTIKIIAEGSEDIDVSITNDFKDYFNPVYDSSTSGVTINKISEVPDTVLKDLSNIPIVLTATLKTTTPVSTSSVVNLKIVNDDDDISEGSLEFDSPLYNGTYVVKDEITFSVDPITIKTDKPEIVDVSISNDYNKYFSASFDSSKLAVTIAKTNNIPAADLKETITLVLSATLTGTQVSASSVVNIKVENENTPGSIQFDNLLYSGTYEIKNKIGTVTTDTIKIIAESSEDIDVSITNDFKDYFNPVYDSSTSEVTINKISEVPDTVLKDLSNIPIVLTATLKTTTPVSTSSVVNLKIVNDDDDISEGSLEFDSPLYNGTYVVKDEITFSVDPITIKTDKPEIVDVSISNDYNKYFSASFDSSKLAVTIAKTNNIPAADLKETITLVLSATLTGTQVSASSVVNIKVENENTPGSIQFDNLLYSGTYEIKNKIGTVTTDTIKIIAESSEDIDVSITNDFKDYFNPVYDSSTSEVTITKISEVPDTVLKDLSNIPIVLTATLKTTTPVSTSSVVNLKIVNDDDDISEGSLEFDSPLYNGTYVVKDEITFSVDPITIKTDKPEIVDVSISNDYNKYFSASFDSSKLAVTIAKTNNIPAADLKDTITLVLSATLTGTKVSATSVVNIKVDNENVDSIEFDNLLYNGKYEIKKKEASIDVDTIKINTDKPDDVVISVTNTYKEYFNVSYTPSTSTVNLIKKADIPDNVLETISTVSIVLSASLSGTKLTANSIVNLRIINDDTPNPNMTGIISFDTFSNTGEYSIQNSQGVLTLDHTIGITTDRQNDEIETSITDDLGLNTYFTTSYSNQVFSVNLASNLPESIVSSYSFISVTLTASIKSTSQKANAVLTIKIDNDDAQDSIDFDSHLYNGVYEIKDSKVTVTVDPIKVVTTDPSIVDVSITNTYKDYFGISYSSSSSLVTITNTKNIPDDILQDISTIAILLSANLKDTIVSAGTVVNLRIVNDDTPTPDNNTGILSFDSVSNAAEYAIENNKGILKFNQTIGITTDRQNDEIETGITDELGLSSDYFSSLYSNQKFTVTLVKDLPAEIFSSKSFITLTLEADIKKTGKKANAVLTIKIDNDQGTDTGHISFANAVYAAVYEITNDIAAISDIDPISIDTDQDDTNVTVSVLNGYDQYFTTNYTNKKVTMSLKSTTPSKTLRSMAYLPVVLLAEIHNSKLSARTVVNFKVIDNDSGDNTDNSTIGFPKLIFDGEYVIHIDDSIDFKLENISLITDRPENQINVTIENEYGYEKYFRVSYSHPQVLISIIGVIPDDVMMDERYIALTLTATVKETSIYSDAVLNIRLKLREPPLEANVTKYVVAISILALFIILLIAAALTFYYFRIRHLKYNKMTEEDYINNNNKVKFDKSALRNSGKTQRSSDIGNRRPTGFIFNSNGFDSEAVSDEARESTTDPADVKERKKSVAFDENVEKLQLDANEDVEKVLDNESTEGSNRD